MTEKLAVEPAALARLIGIYTDEKDNSIKTTVFEKDNALWIKNEVFGNRYEFVGNNTFEYTGLPGGRRLVLLFDLIDTGSVKLTKTFVNSKGEKTISVAVKEPVK